MKKKILFNSIIITFIAIFLSVSIFGISEQGKRESSIDSHMKLMVTNLSDSMYEIDKGGLKDKKADNIISPDEKKKIIKEINYVHDYEENYRFTWIDKNGDVIYDTSKPVGKLENHASRKEVKEAEADKIGFSKRYSSTLSEEYKYCAYKSVDDSVIRVSTTMGTPFKAILSTFSLTIIITTVATAITMMILSKLLKINFTKVEDIARNLGDGSYDEISDVDIDVMEEFMPLAEIIIRQKRQINYYIKSLKDKIKATDEILDNMNEGLIMIDVDDKIVSVNDSAKKLLNYTQDISSENHIVKIIRNPKLLEAINSKEDRTVDIEANDKFLKVFISNLHDSEDNYSGKILFIVDISQSYIEEKYRREFSANISHELKTPLTSINGYAEMISTGLVDQKDVKDFATTILNQGKKLLEMIDDIIKLSKLDEEAGSLIEKVDVDINDSVENLVKMIEPIAKEKNVSINVDMDEDIKIQSVPTMIDELFYNLAVNAINYNRDNGFVNIYAKDYPDRVVFEVEDSGIGIAEDDINRIFERFYRVDKSRNKTDSKSTGLGLAIVKHILIILDGDIDVESEIGTGTRMKVTLPKCKPTEMQTIYPG